MSSLKEYLEKVPSKELFATLTQMGEKVPYNTSKDELIRKITQKVIKNDKDLKKQIEAREWNRRFTTMIISGILMIIIILFFFLLLKINFFPIKNSFCSSNTTCLHDPKNCIKCPSNANCTNGEAFCYENFTLVHRHCIFDDGDAIFIGNLLEKELSMLAKQAGLYSCRYSNEESFTREDLLIKLISTTKLKNVDIEYLANKAVDHLSYEDGIIIQEINGIKYYVSKDVERPFSCRVRITMSNHIKLFFGVVFAIFIFSLIQFRKRRMILKKLKIKDTAHLILTVYSGEKGKINSNEIQKDMKKSFPNCPPKNSQFWKDVFLEVSKNERCTVLPDRETGYIIQFK